MLPAMLQLAAPLTKKGNKHKLDQTQATMLSTQPLALLRIAQSRGFVLTRRWV